ncbi:restriction endonuclease [Priestia koreensis]|uniref:restriction endonuclease n=1 Tax=Priestia koreensis TaxID=284581 RepID=UPI001F566639|nr:restriction endonuclease [Priestia koreensis]
MAKRRRKKEDPIAQLFIGLSFFIFFLMYVWTDSIFLSIFTIFLLIALFVFTGIYRAAKQRERLRRSGINEIDQMKGHRFEHYLKELFDGQGYKSEVTKASGDFGADLVLVKDGQKIIVQAKRYSKKVGVKAIQEIKTAQSYYKADFVWVVTNNYFTNPAIELAKANDVKLINRDLLINYILRLQESAAK